MPKDVFDKIPKDRQLKLIKPAIKEFIKRPYDKINVTSLTDTMKILRTDFYYYFLDKDDLYDRLLDMMKELLEYNQEMTFKEARIILFNRISEISSSRTKTFIEDITESYDPRFTIELTKRIRNMFNCREEGVAPIATVKIKILEFMTVVNLFLKEEITIDQAKEILNR